MSHQRRRRPLAAQSTASTDNVPAPLLELPAAELMERVRAGDAAAFECLFKAYYRPLCTFAYGFVRSREAAEDIVQTVFLRVWERHEAWQPTAGARAYLFAACRNAALDHIRHNQVIARVETIEGAGVEAHGMGGRGQAPRAPDEALHAADVSAALSRAVAELPDRCREVIMLRWQHHLTNEEIAGTLGISVKGVEGHVTRALTALRGLLSAFRS